VLQEFYVNVTRKLPNPVASSTAREVVDTYGASVHEPTTPDTVTRTIDIADVAQISFWDAMIVASAEQAAATVIYGEDLNTGRSIAGIRIVNPLLATQPPLPASVTPTQPQTEPSAARLLGRRHT
jgi:predicted nucleic acid-binding protein